MIIVFIIFSVYFIIPYLIKCAIRSSSLKTIHKKGIHYLTFDDGPHQETTPLILDLLNKSNTKATFFLVGAHIERYPEIIEKIIREGHQIGEHSYYHYHPWKIDPIRYTLDLVKSNKLLKQYITNDSKKKILFRPPFGKINIITLLYIVFTNKKLFFWDIDPKDFISESDSEIVNYIKDNLKNNSIVLLHDHRMNQNFSNMSLTVNTVEQITDRNINRLFHFETLK